jgi:hypothetical protein
LRFRECTVTDSESQPNQCACLSANHMLPAGGLNLKSPAFRGGQGRRLGWPGGQDSENRIAWSRLRDVLCASAAGLHRNPLRIRLPPAPLTRRAGSVAQSSIGRALHGRPAERESRPALPRWDTGRSAPPAPISTQRPPLGAALSPPLRRAGVPEMLGRGRGRVGRGGGSSLQTFGTASGSKSR